MGKHRGHNRSKIFCSIIAVKAIQNALSDNWKQANKSTKEYWPTEYYTVDSIWKKTLYR